MRKISQYFVFILLVLFAGLFFCKQIHLLTADLGRHIQNGAYFFNFGELISTNYYSYTQPDRFSLNHHWGSGVIFFAIWTLFSFEGLSILRVLFAVSGLLFFFKIAERKSNFTFAMFFTFLAIPLVASRSEIRPELISFFFLGLYYYLLSEYRSGRIKFKILYSITFFQVIWVNCHLFFMMGLVVILSFALAVFIANRKLKETGPYLLILFLALLASLLNPYGVQGVLEPFMIFKDYGYMIAENQSIFFMQGRYPTKLLYIHFELIFILGLLSFIFLIVKKQFKNSILEAIFFGGWSLLGWKYLRAMPIFGFFIIPILSKNVYLLFKSNEKKISKILLPTVFVLIICCFFIPGYYKPVKFNTGVTLVKGTNASAEFVKTNKIEGPIFNNYDIGGYLIFHLFPDYKVFVDNRPESYSSAFLQGTYIALQEDEKLWQRRSNEFNIIYFYRHDLTPWAQPFLIRRIEDLSWIPVYVDNYTIILLRNNTKNASLISKYKLPKSLFKVKKPM